MAEEGRVEEYVNSNFAALSGMLFYLIYHMPLKNKPYLAISVERYKDTAQFLYIQQFLEVWTPLLDTALHECLSNVMSWP